MFLEIETGLTVLALVLAFTVPSLSSCWFEAVERTFGKLARRRGLSVVAVGLTALALRAARLTPGHVRKGTLGDGFRFGIAQVLERVDVRCPGNRDSDYANCEVC